MLQHPVEQRGHLGPGQGALGIQPAVAAGGQSLRHQSGGGGFGEVRDAGLVVKLVQHGQSAVRDRFARNGQEAVEQREGLLPGDGVPGGEFVVTHPGGQAALLAPGQGGGEVVGGGHIAEGAGAVHSGLAHGVVQHEDKVAPGDGVIPAELRGADAAANAFAVAVFHRVIGPVVRSDIVVGVGGAHRDGLGQPAGGKGEGTAGAQILGGGEQAVFVHCAHVPLDADRCIAEIKGCVPAPVCARHGELNLLARLHLEGGQGGGAAGPGHPEAAQSVDHMDLSGALQSVAGENADGVGARRPAGGVGAAGDGP